MTFAKATALCWRVTRAREAVKQEMLVEMMTIVVSSQGGRVQVVDKKKIAGMMRSERRRWKT